MAWKQKFDAEMLEKKMAEDPSSVVVTDDRVSFDLRNKYLFCVSTVETINFLNLYSRPESNYSFLTEQEWRRLLLLLLRRTI